MNQNLTNAALESRHSEGDQPGRRTPRSVHVEEPDFPGGKKYKRGSHLAIVFSMQFSTNDR